MSTYEENRRKLNNSRFRDPDRWNKQLETGKQFITETAKELTKPENIQEMLVDMAIDSSIFLKSDNPYSAFRTILARRGTKFLLNKADIPTKVIKKVPTKTVDIAGVIDEPEKIFKGNTLQTIKRKYKPFPIDKKLPFAEQKRIYKKQIATYINEEWATGNQIHLPEAYKKFGQLIDPQTNQVVHLKYKKTDPTTGWRSYEPKPQKTTAKEVALRKSREEPWKTQKKQIKTILKSVNKEEKLDDLITLIKSEYRAKEKFIKESGLTKGHRKSLAKGGLDVPENIIGEQGKTVGKVKGNFARQHKNDPLDEILSKQGGFVGTLEEYVLMRVKEL